MQRENKHVSVWHRKILIFLSDFSSSSSSYESLEISSDDSYDSGTRKNPSKPATSSNKSSTFTAKHKSDNEETPLKIPHQDAFTLKQENLLIIKRLHIKCGFLDTEHLFIYVSI